MKYLLFILSVLFLTACSSNPLNKEPEPDENIACGGRIAKEKITAIAELNGLKMESMGSFTTLESTPMRTKCSMVYKTNDLQSPEQITYTVAYSDDMSTVQVILGD